MGYLLSFIFFSGLIVAALFSIKNSPRWPAKLMLFPSIIAFILYFIIAISFDSNHLSDFYGIFIMALVAVCCVILFFIGLLFYCLKTYAATKANEQLDFLNFQLKDQLNIRSQVNSENK